VGGLDHHEAVRGPEVDQRAVALQRGAEAVREDDDRQVLAGRGRRDPHKLVLAAARGWQHDRLDRDDRRPFARVHDLDGRRRQQPVRRTVRVRLPMRLPRPTASAEIEALLESVKSLRDLAITLLMLDGGLRPGEVLGLHLDDVSYGRRRVTIRKRDDHPHGVRGKSRRERVVDLHLPRTLEAVSRYVLHERPTDAESPFVFLVGGNGVRRDEPLSYQASSGSPIPSRRCRLGAGAPTS
jgi:integrase